MFKYLLLGIGFYLGAAFTNSKRFKNASIFGIIRGLIFDVLLWPAAILFLSLRINDSLKGKK